MKAAFFSVFTLALSVFAAPVVDSNIKPVEITTRDSGITDAQDLITKIQGAVSSIQAQKPAFNKIISDVQSGDSSEDEGADDSLPELNTLLTTLTDLMRELTGAAGLDVTDSDVQTLHTLLVTLVSEVLTIVKGLVAVLGVAPQLDTILHNVFQILAKVLTLVIGLVGTLVPGLVAALSPLLAGLGNGLLAPLLTLVAGLTSGLAA